MKVDILAVVTIGKNRKVDTEVKSDLEGYFRPGELTRSISLAQLILITRFRSQIISKCLALMVSVYLVNQRLHRNEFSEKSSNFEGDKLDF